MQLRWYQRQAVDSVYDHLRRRDDSPCVVIPTGGGKTPVIATICRDAVFNWQGRVAVVAHVKELLEQTRSKLNVVAPDLPVGVYSAGLGMRDLDKPVVVAGVQSIHRRACDLGPVNLIIVDEAHCIPCEDDGMYNRFIAEARVVNPGVRVIGMTATPFRLKSGLICAPGNVLNHVCYEVGIKPLIGDGYLCPLRSKAGRSAPDTQGLHVRAGEFVAGEAENLMDDDALVATACAEVAELTANRRGVLVFCAGVRHCAHVVREFATSHGIECGMVTAKTPKADRSAIIERFKGGDLKYLANVNVLTTGFDATHIDCVVLLRPTASTGLYYQMVGRGFRPDPGKRDCLVLDYGGNVERHGPVDELNINQLSFNGGGAAPAKQCPECDALISAGYAASTRRPKAPTTPGAR